jgi:hypothetical protein
MGFCSTLCGWVKRILNDDTISVKINNVLGNYLQSAKGVIYCDPLYPFLFNAEVQCLAKKVFEARKNNIYVYWFSV